MHIIMFRHHQHLLKINVKLFVVLQMYHNGIVPHNYLQRSIHAHYLMYFTNIKVSRLQAAMGKYLSLEGFRTSITTSISNVSPKNHSFIIELTHILLGGNAEFLSHPAFLSVVRTTKNESLTDKFPFFSFETNSFLSFCCLLACFCFFNY